MKDMEVCFKYNKTLWEQRMHSVTEGESHIVKHKDSEPQLIMDGVWLS